MIGFLQLVTVVVIVPFLTYHAIGGYVWLMMSLHRGFKLWGGRLDFQPIDLGDLTPEDLMDKVHDFIDDK